ncbi:response regulator [Arsenicicoccus sp. oral taxon 190]|uniref:response regulator n=1 Tax=Arsenicicoccus sp. oral taxon 190 TaxID=1658671 RepID=UPI000679F1A1|nr:response regulator transcription factor [Arsenicicoccus sp. oral taxon 190]AKT51352.1 hypothetical protein ADJ73_08505 [Arsenicicoccus sp. oral taxon 190]
MADHRAVVADDQALMRGALVHFLEAGGEFEVVAEATDGDEAVEAVLAHRPDVVLMDLHMPRLSGVAATARVLEQWPAARVLAVTTFAATGAVVPMLRAGAAGYVLKDATPEQLVASARAVVEGRGSLDEQVVAAVVDEVRSGRSRPPELAAEAARVRTALSDGEARVLELLAEGLGKAQIARELDLSEATVKARLGRLMTKMGVLSRVQAVVRGCELGLVRPRLR